MKEQKSWVKEINQKIEQDVTIDKIHIKPEGTMKTDVLDFTDRMDIDNDLLTLVLNDVRIRRGSENDEYPIIEVDVMEEGNETRLVTKIVKGKICGYEFQNHN